MAFLGCLSRAFGAVRVGSVRVVPGSGAAVHHKAHLQVRHAATRGVDGARDPHEDAVRPLGIGHMTDAVDLSTKKTMKLKLNNEITERRLGKVRPDYKNIKLLSQYVDRNGMILGRKKTGMTAWNQKKMTRAIKRARQFGLMPVVGKLVCYTEEEKKRTTMGPGRSAY